MAQRSVSQYPTRMASERTAGYMDTTDSSSFSQTVTKYKPPTIHNWARWLCVGWGSIILMGVVQQWASPDSLYYYQSTASASAISTTAASQMYVGLWLSSPPLVVTGGILCFASLWYNGNSIRLASHELSDCETLHSNPQALTRAQQAYSDGKNALGGGSSLMLATYVRAQEPTIGVTTQEGNVCAGVMFSHNTFRAYQAGVMIHAVGQMLMGLLICLGLLYDLRHLLRWIDGTLRINAAILEYMMKQDQTGAFRRLVQVVATQQSDLEHLNSN